PLDGSALAEGALPRAAEIAVESGARMILLRAAFAHAYPGANPIEAQVVVIRDAETYLADVAARVRALGVRDVQRSVWYGEPAPARRLDHRHPRLRVRRRRIDERRAPRPRRCRRARGHRGHGRVAARGARAPRRAVVLASGREPLRLGAAASGDRAVGGPDL